MPRFLTSLLILITILPLQSLHAQENKMWERYRLKHRLWELEAELAKGNKEALGEVITYLDSKQEMTVPLGWHMPKFPESDVAKRILSESCLFLKSEFDFSNFTRKNFVRFLKANEDKIVFSEWAGAFLITPLEDREVIFELHNLPESRRENLLERKGELLSLPWVKEQGIDTLVAQRNPYALLKIASLYHRNRDRISGNNPNEHDYINLLQMLTNTIIAVPKGNEGLDYKIAYSDSDYSLPNLLIFFVKHYHEYVWDEEQSVFVLPGAKIEDSAEIRRLFALLGDNNDTVAIHALKGLTTSDPERVVKFAIAYEHIYFNEHISLSHYVLGHLQQLVVLTDYCRKNGMDFQGSVLLQARLDSLRNDLPIEDCYRLEKEILSQLTLKDITAIEYWTVIYSEWRPRSLTSSAARIVPQFYAQHWNEITADTTQLKAYLKKSALFERLENLEQYHNYHVRFSNASPATLRMLTELQTEDADIQEQINKVLALNKYSK